MESPHGIRLISRIAAEHRRSLIAIGLTCAVGILTYVFVVYPLAQRVANIEQRDRAAEQALAAAQAELAQVSGTLTGKARASTELMTFYTDVLPQDLAGARRLTYLRLARLARETNLDYERSSVLAECRDRQYADAPWNSAGPVGYLREHARLHLRTRNRG